MLNQRNRLGNELTQQYRQLRGRVSDVAAHALGSPRPLASKEGEGEGYSEQPARMIGKRLTFVLSLSARGEAELLALTPIVSRTL